MLDVPISDAVEDMKRRAKIRWMCKAHGKEGGHFMVQQPGGGAQPLELVQHVQFVWS
jgi:hypothetical protein